MGKNYSKEKKILYRKYFPNLELIVYGDNEKREEFTKNLLEIINDDIDDLEIIIIDYIKKVLKSKKSNDNNKLYSVMLLKDILEAGNHKFVIYLEKKLLNRLYQISIKEKINKPYVHLILELIDIWGDMYGITSQNKTKFYYIKEKLKNHIPLERKYSWTKNNDENINSIKFYSYNDKNNKSGDNIILKFIENIEIFEKFLDNLNFIILDRNFWGYDKFKEIFLQFSNEFQTFYKENNDDISNIIYTKYSNYFNKISEFIKNIFNLINNSKQVLYHEITKEYITIYKRVLGLTWFRLDNNSLNQSRFSVINEDIEYLEIKNIYENSNYDIIDKSEVTANTFYVNLIKNLVLYFLSEKKDSNLINWIGSESKAYIRNLSKNSKEYRDYREVNKLIKKILNGNTQNIRELENKIKTKIRNPNLKISLINLKRKIESDKALIKSII